MFKSVARVFGVSQLLLVVLCGLLEVANIPDSLEVKMDTAALVGVQVGYPDETGKIVYDRERPFSAFGEMGVTRVVLSTSHSLSEMAWGFKNGPCEIKLNSVIVKKWLLIPFKLPAHLLLENYTPTNGMVVGKMGDDALSIRLEKESGYFVLKKGMGIPLRIGFTKDFVLQLVGAEILLLIMSFVAVLCKLTDEKVGKKLLFSQICIVSFITACFFCFVLPMQSYLVNRMSWTFSMGSLLCFCSMWTLACFVGLAMILFILKFGFGRIPLAIILGIVFYCYLETGLLSIGLPVMNGDIGFFVTNVWRGKIDIIICAVIVLSSVLTYKWAKHYLHFVALALAILMVASLFDVRVEEQLSQSNSVVENFCSSEELIDSAFYSGKENKLVFIVDTVTTEVVKDILDEDAEIKKAFSGFIAFTNNVGMHQMTAVGVPGIMLGYYLDTSTRMREYESSAMSTNSFMASYITDNIPTFFMFSLTRPFNWSSEKNSSRPKLASEGGGDITPFKCRLEGLQAWNLLEVIRFRLTPFMFKWHTYLMTIKDWPLYEKGAAEFCLFPKLAKLPIKGNVDQTLHVYHTVGAHAPFFTDRYGKKLLEPGSGYEGYFEKAYFVVSNLAKLFKDLKERGVYDNSLIIFTSDHGSNFTRHNVVDEFGRTLPGSKPFPVLMVKPVGGKGDLRYSAVPTSHSKIATLIMRAQHEVLKEEDISNVLHQDNRLFRFFGKGEHYDWVFYPDGRITFKSFAEH